MSATRQDSIDRANLISKDISKSTGKEGFLGDFSVVLSQWRVIRAFVNFEVPVVMCLGEMDRMSDAELDVLLKIRLVAGLERLKDEIDGSIKIIQTEREEPMDSEKEKAKQGIIAYLRKIVYESTANKPGEFMLYLNRNDSLDFAKVLYHDNVLKWGPQEVPFQRYDEKMSWEEFCGQKRYLDCNGFTGLEIGWFRERTEVVVIVPSKDHEVITAEKATNVTAEPLCEMVEKKKEQAREDNFQQAQESSLKEISGMPVGFNSVLIDRPSKKPEDHICGTTQKVCVFWENGRCKRAFGTVCREITKEIETEIMKTAKDGETVMAEPGSNPMDFSEALKRLKLGNKVCRKLWGDAVSLQNIAWIELQRPDDHSKMTVPYLYMGGIFKRTEPWVPDQTDLMAEDWLIY